MKKKIKYNERGNDKLKVRKGYKKERTVVMWNRIEMLMMELMKQQITNLTVRILDEFLLDTIFFCWI